MLLELLSEPRRSEIRLSSGFWAAFYDLQPLGSAEKGASPTTNSMGNRQDDRQPPALDFMTCSTRARSSGVSTE